MSTTPNFSLYKPLNGEVGWGALVDANCDVIDTQMKANADAVTTEAAARIAAIAAEAVARIAAVSAEATARSNADALLAPLASPALTGNPTVPTQSALTNNTRAASTAYADAAVAVEVSARGTAVSGEATARTNADALKANITSLSAAAFSGLYADLLSKPQLAVTNAGGTHNFLTTYDATTGLFTKAQPAAADVTGLATVATSGSYVDLSSKPQLAQTKAAVSSNFFTAYDAATGLFTAGQPLFSDISGIATLAQLPTGYTWDKLGSAAGALTLANGTNNTTFNQTSAATWKWANTTPTFASLVLTQAAIAGTTVTYTGTITGGGSNAYVGATATIAGFVNGGNNGAFVVTASTATTLVVTNAGGVNETHAGTAVGAAQSSPINSFSAQYSTSPIGTAEDTWTVQSVLGSTAVNAASALVITHSGSTGAAQVVFPNGLASKPSITFAGFLTEGLWNSGTSLVLASGGVVYTSIAGTTVIGHSNSAICAGSAIGIGFSSTASPSGTAGATDTRIFRSAAGVLGLGGTTNTTPCDLIAPSANGASWKYGQSSELLTLSTVGLTTDTVGNLLPAGAMIDAVVCRITTAITTATNWAVGDASQAARFSSANATLTLGTTSIGLNQADPTVASANLGPVQAAAAKVRITCTGSNPTTGILRITVFYRQFTPPAS